MRRYSEHEIDAAVLASQEARQTERIADPRWTVVEDDLSDVLGPTWRYESIGAGSTPAGPPATRTEP